MDEKRIKVEKNDESRVTSSVKMKEREKEKE
jgi:hypothetical protein